MLQSCGKTFLLDLDGTIDFDGSTGPLISMESL